MLKFLSFLYILSSFIKVSESARILAVFPVPFISHQSVFRPLSNELAKRGHEVVVITPDPAPKNNLLPNLKQIDVRDVSVKFSSNYSLKVAGQIDNLYDQVKQFSEIFGKVFEVQLNTVEVQNLIQDKEQHFDLILTEACASTTLIFTHLFKAPAIAISSLGSAEIYTKFLGLPVHPILYPTFLAQKLYNLSIWEKAIAVYKKYEPMKLFNQREKEANEFLKRKFGEDVPTLSELNTNVAMLMINIHHIWEGNRPVPPNVVYLGGLHLATNRSKDLSKDLLEYLDASKHGVIYVSFGSIVQPSTVKNLKIVTQAFSHLPYDVLLKWDNVHLPDCPNNVRVIKWVPQKELLQHPKIKLFITQAGIQSTDEAILAGVPLIGIPLLGDQWYNAEQYVHFRIGIRIDLEDVTQTKMLDTIHTVINDTSYKRNIIALRSQMYDQPQSSLERAVWWTEYILRHGRSKHLMSPAAGLSSWEFFEVDLILLCLSLIVSFATISVYIAHKLIKGIHKTCSKMKVKQQ